LIDGLQEVIRHIEHEWSGKRLLVVGDVMLDKYIWGDVGRISPEAPVPVVRVTHQTEQPGGAANVAMNLARLGANIALVGFVGGDENERALVADLERNAIRPLLVKSVGFPTITKLRILGGSQQMLRLDTELLGDRPAAEYDRLMQRALSEVPGCHAVVLSDYAKGTLTAEVCQKIITAARDANVPVLVDPKSSDLSRYRGATTVCPNLAELAAAAREDMHHVERLLASAERMVSEFDLQFMTATLGERGMAFVGTGRRVIHPAIAKQVFDVSGAGDTVIAVLALALASGLPPETAVQLANVAAGIVVGKIGTVPIEKHELLYALGNEIALHAEGKVVSRHELGLRVNTWRANHERIVFTNGCFDLLHVGHIALLESARLIGDRLIIAINSDASVSRLKGQSRPIVGERERARVLAALACVDAVVVFDEPTPLELIVATRPDTIVKGGDYNIETVVGAREIQSWGGQVRIVPIVDGHSTTRLLARSAMGGKDS
jgi:D-beta-D-heptose 7-phosphate kinase/D-beta-D-heptose 1-phosphate adenosyltransferase